MSDRMEIQEELNVWLDEHFSPELTLREWRERLADGHWAAVEWPSEYLGRDYSPEQAVVVARVLANRKVIGGGGGRRLAAEAVVVHGTHAQKQKYLRPSLTGEHHWCQLFSEPGNGSDLAGATTMAVRDGDHWLINGEKCWTTGAQSATHGMLLARTDWEVPKHQGLSYFLLDMNQPGVEVRPLRQMNGYASFYEVVLADAIVDHADLVGGEGNGWAVTGTSLSFERSRFVDERVDIKGCVGRLYDEFRREARAAAEPTRWYPQRAGRSDLALPCAVATGSISDPIVRQEVARLICLQRGADLSAARAAASKQTGKNNPGGSIGKLAASDIARQCAHVQTLIHGEEAMLKGEESPLEGVIAEILLSVPAMSIAGGTDEIQKNILAERILEMPKEARADEGPFRDVARNPGKNG